MAKQESEHVHTRTHPPLARFSNAIRSGRGLEKEEEEREAKYRRAARSLSLSLSLLFLCALVTLTALSIPPLSLFSLPLGRLDFASRQRQNGECMEGRRANTKRAIELSTCGANPEVNPYLKLEL